MIKYISMNLVLLYLIFLLVFSIIMCKMSIFIHMFGILIIPIVSYRIYRMQRHVYLHIL